MENIIVESCSNCPCYSDDSDNGSTCSQGADIRQDRSKNIYTVVGGILHVSLPKSCPLLKEGITITLSPVYDAYKVDKPKD